MVTISKYYSSVTKKGVKPSNPGNVVTVIPEVLNPPDSPVGHNPVTIGSPANGLSLVGQELSLGLASSGVTGALSGTDWGTFNGKIGGTIASGQVAFGTGAGTVGGSNNLFWNNTNGRLGIGTNSPLSTFDFRGLGIIQGTTASDSGQLGTELLTTGTGDASWIGIDFATGYTHVAGSVTTLTSTLAGVVSTFYQITYTVTGRTAGSFTIAFGGQSFASLTTTGAVGPRATTTGTLVITPTSDFNGTIVLSIRVISSSTASVTFTNSSGAVTNQIRISNLSSNTFIGFNAGINATTGESNSFYGRNSGQNTTTGGGNSFFGINSGQSTTIGGSNSFFGRDAGINLISGNSNSFFGRDSGRSTTTGASNSFFGVDSGRSNTTGNNNSFLGLQAGINQTTGSLNVMLGRDAGRFIADGSNLTVSDNSIFIGFDARANSNSQTNQIVIGHQAIGGGSNTVVIGNSSIVSNRFFGTLRVGTISNLGSTATRFLVASATGVVSERTGAEMAADIGALPSASLTIASGQVAFGTGVNTIGGDSGFLFNSITKVLTTTADAVVNGVNIGRGAGNIITNTRVGNGALNANTTGSTNTSIGVGALKLNQTGSKCTAVGYLALESNISGLENTSVGYIAGGKQTGSFNSFFGAFAGHYTTTGNNNSFFGTAAGTENTTGSSNSFFGRESGRNNTTANNNSFFGRESGYENTTGAANCFFGDSAGRANTTGSFNSFFGLNSGEENTTGLSNSFFGENSGQNKTTGNNNSFFGVNSGDKISGGTDLTTADNSVFIGYDTRANANNQTNQIVIGFETIGAGSNTTTIGNTSITDNYIRGNFNITDAKNIVLATGTGTKIGTATTQKIAFWNSTPIVQPTTAVTAATLVSNLGTPLTSTDTFDGYTLAQIVKALRNTGLLA